MDARTIGLFLSGLTSTLSLFAVYAPLPEDQKDEGISIQFSAGVFSDSNIFGAPVDEQSSLVYQLNPTLQADLSLSPRTLFDARYSLNWQHFTDRPGESDQATNHELGLKLAHTFSERLFIELTDDLAYIENPASALPGTTFQTNQTFWTNRLGLRLDGALDERLSLAPRLSQTLLRYDQDELASLLDRDELFGALELRYTLSRRLDLAVEGRFKGVRYETDDDLKGSDSYYALAGFNYSLGPRLFGSLRLGAEQRQRATNDESTFAFAEGFLRYAYAESSVLTLSSAYSVNEADDTLNYTEARGPSLGLSLVHDLTGRQMLYALASLNYRQSTLRARPGNVAGDLDEQAWQAGFAMLWKWSPAWSLRTSYDYDQVFSDSPTREQQRHRFGLSLAFRFGLF